MRDPVRLSLQVGLYIFLYFATAFVFGPLLVWIGGYLLGVTLAGLAGALLTNTLTLRIYEGIRLPDIGLRWGGTAAWNLGLGLVGGIASAVLVLGVPVLTGLAHFRPAPDNPPSMGTFLFTSLMLFFGAAGEEILFRGFAFQILLRAFGPWTTILPVGVVFALLHAANPNSTWLGLVNTAGFGILFGYAFLRSCDLWLPIGLHYGWNFTLPLFGAEVSGIRIGVTGYELEWKAAELWSGGRYGPEGGLLASAVLLLLAVYIRKVPVQPAENRLCAPGSPQPS
jgi:membrane protease YdiL (CAAX protease family)